MSRDYKHRIPGYRKRRLQIPRVWVITAAGIAGAVGLAVHFFSGTDSEENPKAPETVSIPVPSTETTAASSDTGKKNPQENKKKPGTEGNKPSDQSPEQKTETIKPREPRFTFYKILPEKEVIIPESEIKIIKREESRSSKPPAGLYLVQAGSFDNLRNAEQLKADLAKIKIKAKIEKIEIENSTWYRVKLGPYATLADADKIRAYLRTKGIDSIVQKAAK
ncbi:SPOR domain-containing protein [Methylocaldum szegediense]|uniref:Sporulation related protein n=1 Tax=Methylocaldum szegediense TaxID=73780 RepID=A0ABM9I2G6_9GAMM|nr:SPOR domain-containing protein [Methylocaldum szegediense]CAI8847991.1 Sporulation related protein [Methylocaldum szegediense]